METQFGYASILVRRWTRRTFDLVLAGIAVISAAGAFAAYAWVFKANRIGGPEQWAHFGDYIGGLLNPIIGLVTVFLVVLTLRTTRIEAEQTRTQLERQIELLHREQTLKDMQRRLDGWLVEWQRILENETIPHTRTLVGVDGATFKTPIKDALTKIEVRSRLVRAKEAAPNRDAFSAKGWNYFKRDIVPLLHELDQYCVAYESQSRSTTLTDFYKARVRMPVECLRLAGVLSEITARRLLNEKT